jgi:hypothetical protein
MVGWSSLRSENAAYRGFVFGIGAETVNGFGGKRDGAAATQDSHGGSDLLGRL